MATWRVMGYPKVTVAMTQKSEKKGAKNQGCGHQMKHWNTFHGSKSTSLGYFTTFWSCSGTRRPSGSRACKTCSWWPTNWPTKHQPWKQKPETKKSCLLKHYFFCLKITAVVVLHHINVMGMFISPVMSDNSMEKGLERVYTTASVENIPRAHKEL